MEHGSLAEYPVDFLRYGHQWAYVQRHEFRIERWTYRQVAELAFQVARELEERGIQKGERVLLWGRNSAQWVATFFACILRGVVVVPIDDVATADFAASILRQVEARLAICSRAHPIVAAAHLTLEELPQQVARHAADPYPAANLVDDDTLQIVFTSGTTAEPKGVIISHGNVLANLRPLEREMRTYMKYERLVHPVRFLSLLPLSHVFGQFLGIFLPQLMAGTVIFQDSLKPADLIRTIRQERVSVLVAVPRMLQSLQEAILRNLEPEGKLKSFHRSFAGSEHKHFLRRWWIFRHVRRQFGWKFWALISGGATLDRNTEQFWGRLGYAVVQGYGLTETTSLISVNHPFRLGKGSIGKVLAGREVRLAPDGEILVRGGGVAQQYWSQGGTRAVSDDGWYATGDIGELDAANNLYFKGRKKEVIVTSAGMNVYPADLEAVLRSQPEVKDCVVIALPRGGNAEPCAVVIPRASAEPIQGAVDRANQGLAEYQRIRYWVAWPEQDFPRTATQKPKIAQIQQLAIGMMSHATAGRSVSGGAVAEFIARLTGRAPGTLSGEARLDADLGLSSLDRVELLGAIEDRFQTDLSEASFVAANTIADLERLIHGSVGQRARYDYPRWALGWPVTWIRILSNYTLLLPSVFLLGWPRIVGRENLGGVRGPVLVICNHIGDIDVGFVLTALPARFRNRLATATGGEALQALRTPSATRFILARIYDRVRWALGVALLNLFPLPREAGFRHSFAYAAECVDRGYSVLIFPEGRHTSDGLLLPFRAGIGLLVNDLGIPVVPLRIDGLFTLKQAGKKFAPPHAIRITIGKPVQFPPDSDPVQIARTLQNQVQEL